MGLVSVEHFVYDFSRKIFLMLYSINCLNFIVWLSLLPEIYSNTCMVVICCLACDVMDFEINWHWRRTSIRRISVTQMAHFTGKCFLSNFHLNSVDTRRRFSVYKTSIRHRRHLVDAETTSCVYWEENEIRILNKKIIIKKRVIIITTSGQTSTTNGQTSTTNGQTSTTNGLTNGQTSTTSGKTSTVLRAEKRELQPDKRVLPVDNWVLHVLRVIKRVLWVTRRVLQVPRVTR